MRLYVLPLGKIQPGDVPVVGYLIQTESGTNILVDTGFPYSYIADPPRESIVMHEEDYVVNRLTSLGLHPAEIDILVCTHLDADHAGNNEVFLHAEQIIQRENYELGRVGHARFESIREHWDAYGLNIRLVDGDTTLVPGVELIETSGHVPGHQAVLVRLPKTGPVLLAVDAIPHSSMLNPDTRPIHSADMDEGGTRASTRKLREIARREGVKLIIHGHDAGLWPTLKHAPEFYD